MFKKKKYIYLIIIYQTDLSENDIPIEDAEEVLEVLKHLPDLRVLRLVGNPVVRTTAFNYRCCKIVK
jgi:hypothetical protein